MFCSAFNKQTGALQPALQRLGIKYLVLGYSSILTSSDAAELKSTVKVIKTGGYRVILLIAKTIDMMAMLAASQQVGLGDPSRYMWIHNCNFIRTRNTTQSIYIVPVVQANSKRVAYQKRWPHVSTRWNGYRDGFFNAKTKMPFFGANEYSSVIWDTDYSFQGDGVPDEWAMYVYDTVWVFALALDSILKAGGDPGDGCCCGRPC